MPDQAEGKDVQPAEKRNTPAIRTMKSDVEELVQKTKPSFLDMVSQEVRRSTPPASFPRTGRKWIFVGAGGGALLIAAAAALILFFRQTGEEPQPAPVVPPPFFITETSRTITVREGDRSLFLRLFEDAAREEELLDTMKRVVIKLRTDSEERILSLAELFSFYRITPPANFIPITGAPLMTFFHQSSAGLRFGFAVRIRDQERALAEILKWEPSLLLDFRPFLFDEEPEQAIAPFEDRIYRNIDWRFLKLSATGDLGIAYGVFPARDLLIFTISKESFEAVINRLFAP